LNLSFSGAKSHLGTDPYEHYHMLFNPSSGCPKKILISIGHPADAHFFSHFITEIKTQDHTIFVAAREKEITYHLLEKFDIPFFNISSHKDTLPRKIRKIHGDSICESDCCT
jgi:hypothetical protein